MHRPLAWIAGLVLVSAAPAARADFSYSDFSNTSGLQFTGAARLDPNSPNVVLAPAVNPNFYGDYGGLFTANKVTFGDGGTFSSHFSFRIDPPASGGGDGPGNAGFSFMVLTAPAAGGSLGAGGANPLLSVSFDPFSPAYYDAHPSELNRVWATRYDFNVTAYTYVEDSARFNDGQLWHAWVDYDGSQNKVEARWSHSAMRPAAAELTLLASNPYNFSGQAYVGFGALEGPIETARILSWDFATTALPKTYTWTAGGSSNGFNDPGNWNPNGTPGSIDTIQFGVGSNAPLLPAGGATVSNIVTQPNAYPVFMNALSADTPLNTGTLNLNSNSSLTLINTRLSVDSDVSIQGVSLTVNGGATLNAGTVATPGTHSVTLNNGSAATIDNGGAMQASSLVANGIVNLNNGSLTAGSITGSGSVKLETSNVHLHVTGTPGLVIGRAVPVIPGVVQSPTSEAVTIGMNSQLIVDGLLKIKPIDAPNNAAGLTADQGTVEAGSVEVEGGNFTTAGIGAQSSLRITSNTSKSIVVHGDGQTAIPGQMNVGTSTIDGGLAMTVGQSGTLNLRSSLLFPATLSIGGNQGTGTVAIANGGSLILGTGGGAIAVNNGGLLDLQTGSSFSPGTNVTINVNAGGTLKSVPELLITPGATLALNGGALQATEGVTVGVDASNNTGIATVNVGSNARGSFGDFLYIAGGSTVQLAGGSQLTAGQVYVGGFLASANASNDNVLIVRGGASLAPKDAISMPVYIGDIGTGNNQLRIQSGGIVNTGTANTYVYGGFVVLDGGTLRTNKVINPTGFLLTFNSGTLALTGTAGYTVDAMTELGDNPTLTAGQTLEITNATTIPAGKQFTLNGGTLNTGSLDIAGTFNFNAGTLGITGPAGLTIGSGGFFGSSFTVGNGRTVTATSATINLGASLTLGGGAFGSDNLTNNGTVFLSGGSLSTLTSGGTLTNASTGRIFVPNSSLIVVGGAMTNAAGGRITLQGGAAQLAGTGALTNSGLITGDGEIAKPVTNALTGEIRATAGQALLFSGANGTNAGRINVLGGSVEFSQPITNASAGTITGHGSYFFAGGLANQGQMQFSGGNSDVYGNVALTGGAASNAKIINSAGANVVTFFGNVVHNGSEVRTAAGSATVFYGAVSGAGSFTGAGTADFEGTYSPGNSPASVSVEGSLRFGGNSALTMELAGPTPGAQYDQLHIGGSLNADGSLLVTLLDGFSPVSGQAFDLFDWGSLTGQFASFTLPALTNGLSWNTSQLYTRGILSVGVPGDFSGDGVSNAADYVLLRKAGGSGAAANYNVWRSSFNSGGSIGAGGAIGAVPEPTSAMMTLICATVLMLSTYRRSGRPEASTSIS